MEYRLAKEANINSIGGMDMYDVILLCKLLDKDNNA